MAKRNKERNRRHDAAFKNLYSFRLMAWGLMEIAQPRALFEELDFDTLERLPTEWFGPGLERRMGDCVWRVGRRGGGPALPGYTLVDLGRVRVEDLPQGNRDAGRRRCRS